MAEQAFALSPISASASLPSQADYDAIGEAFMETARGRWFLAEYARRNRNADTAMVLDAVARIERTLAAQKQPAPLSDAPDVMPAVTAILAAARANTETAFANPNTDDALAQARKSARAIREIAWGLRESGSDNRICGFLDAQVDAIDAACVELSTRDLRGGVLGAFDRAADKMADLAKSIERPVPGAATPAKTPFEKPKIVPANAEAIKAATVNIETAKAATKIEATVVRLEQPQSVTPPAAPVAHAIDEAALFANIGGSLGASLLVSGIVPKPVSPKSDPLAPIRRMSAAEKIAFFS